MARPKRKPVSIEHLNAGVQKMIEGKTHREIAILGGALIEGMLQDILKELVVDSPFQRASSLFEYPRPLSSFGNMLSLAFAFGTISETEFSMISLIKEIRNYAAHSIGLDEEDEFDFAKDPVRSMLFKFYPVHAMNAAPQELKTKIRTDFDRMMASDPKLAYRMVFCFAEVSLMARQAISERLSAAQEINEGVNSGIEEASTPTGNKPPDAPP